MNTALLTCMLVWPNHFGGVQEIWSGPDAPLICEASRNAFPIMYSTDRQPDVILCTEDHIRKDGTPIRHSVGIAFGQSVPGQLNLPDCGDDGTHAW